MKKVMIVMAMLSLSGCATQAVLPNQAKSAPSDKVIKYQSESNEASSTLIVVRDKGYLGSMCSTGVYLNDEKAAILEPGEKATFHLKPGEWSVAVKGEGVCLTDAVPSGDYFNLQANGTKALRLFASPSGTVEVKPLPMK